MGMVTTVSYYFMELMPSVIKFNKLLKFLFPATLQHVISEMFCKQGWYYCSEGMLCL